MAGKDAFQVEGVIAEVLSPKTYRIELSNGYRLLGFEAGKMAGSAARYRVGDRVKLQLSSFDLSEGRILLEKIDI
jgi:translation initiation factor IF-1